MIYLDNNATTMPSARCRDAMIRAVDELWHNPSSMYRAGQAAKRAVELGRASIARLINAQPKELVFCGCGTCSIHTAMNGAVVTHRDVENPNIITTHVEHPAVRYLAKQVGERMGVETRWLPTTPGGRIDAGALEKLIDERTILVSVQWANNETGRRARAHLPRQGCHVPRRRRAMGRQDAHQRRHGQHAGTRTCQH